MRFHSKTWFSAILAGGLCLSFFTGCTAEQVRQNSPQAAEGKTILLQNDSMALVFASRTGILQAMENRLTGETYRIRGDEFAMETADGCVKRSDMKRTSTACRDRELSVRYEHPNVLVEVVYELGNDHHFAEKRMSLTFRKNGGLKQIVVGDPTFTADGLTIVCYRYPNFDILTAAVKAQHGWERHRPPDSEPNRTFFGRTSRGGFFLGVEMPYDASELEKNRVTLRYAPSLKIKAGQTLPGETVYLGVYCRSEQDRRETNSWRSIETLWKKEKTTGGFNGTSIAEAGESKPEIKVTRPAILPLPSESQAMSKMVSMLYGPPRHGIMAEGCGCFSQLYWFEDWNTEEELEEDLSALAFFPPCGLDLVGYIRPWCETEKINGLREGDRYKLGPKILRMLDRDAELGMDSAMGITLTNTFPWSRRGLPFRLDEPSWLRAFEGKPTSANDLAFRTNLGNCMGCQPFNDWLEQLLMGILTSGRFKHLTYDSDFWGTGAFFQTIVPVTCTADYHDHLPGDSNYACQKALQRLITRVRQTYPDLFIMACRPSMDLGIWMLRHTDACFTLIESGMNKPNLVAGNEIRIGSRIRVHHQFLPHWLDQSFLFPMFFPPKLGSVTPWPGEHLDYILLSALSGSPNLLMNLPAKTGIPESDKQTIKKWLDWARQNVRYILVRKDLPDWPEPGKVDGSAHIIARQGFIFLFNPNDTTLQGEFALSEESIGLKGDGSYQIRQYYPDAEQTQTLSYGQTVRWNVPPRTAIILEIRPAP